MYFYLPTATHIEQARELRLGAAPALKAQLPKGSRRGPDTVASGMGGLSASTVVKLPGRTTASAMGQSCRRGRGGAPKDLPPAKCGLARGEYVKHMEEGWTHVSESEGEGSRSRPPSVECLCPSSTRGQARARLPCRPRDLKTQLSPLQHQHITTPGGRGPECMWRRARLVHSLQRDVACALPTVAGPSSGGRPTRPRSNEKKLA